MSTRSSILETTTYLQKMTLNKLLSFALLAVTIVMMMGRCSAYYDDAFWQCYHSGPCYRYPNGTQQGCPRHCGCVSRRW
ncbi:hypothetical protein V5799_010502 [Amblyomma americanum]|uniref:Uncharacterized protein n=1 Tax=Amblyomma americanum TaxID=6943 RepID=A0AAQ4EJI0_AMBAM